jgi:type VI secretion system protein ImpF
MAELTQKERLQPSLLDRLTDDRPEERQESRDKHVLSPSRLRDCVRRDLTWLLNTTNLAATEEELNDFPEVMQSVVNYGMPDLAGRVASSVDVRTMERNLLRVIASFEPRLMKASLKVKLVHNDQRMDVNAMTFDIEAELWAQPLPLRLFLRTEIDLENGGVKVTETTGQSTGLRGG